MKREYVTPVIESEEFIPNEYIAGCYSCMNMNSAKAVYNDIDGDGELDQNEYNDANKVTGWNFMNDCYMTGDADAAAHSKVEVNSLDKVLVYYSETNVVPAYKLSGTFKDSPHFISTQVNPNASN